MITYRATLDVPRELAASCGIMLWLVTFVAVIPLGLLLADQPDYLVAAAAANDAKLQMIVLMRPTRRTPKRSSKSPQGSCSAAYGQL